MTDGPSQFDVVIVGAGFAGLYALYKARSAGFSVKVIEAGSDVGGTWYWNRYPGARCDVESVDYSYSFLPELEQEWHWSARYGTQAEILSYLRHVTERLDLRRDIQFDTRVRAMEYDAALGCWTILSEQGDIVSARFCVMATGCLSSAQTPALPGAEDYSGHVYHTGTWPGPVDFRGQRVGVIGTGSSGIQVIPEVAAQADHVYVFQRTPNFSMPARDRPLDPETERQLKANYRQRRAAARRSPGGLPEALPTVGVYDVDDTQRRAILERAWALGGNAMQFSFTNILLDPATNDVVSDFMRSKIREVVADPQVAEALCPKDYPFAAKRVCKDTDFYETFNRSNVDLVDLRTEPLVGLYTSGVRTEARPYEVDSLIFATGFDAFTGALLQMDIVGRDGIRLADAWAEGPKTYLGLMVAGFPNLFVVTGPGSPSVLTNMVNAIEQHVEWISDCLTTLQAEGHKVIEASEDAATEWVATTNEAASRTLYMQASSWYLGANIPGKPRVFMPYPGGLDRYREICNEVATAGYKGFLLS